jgi:RNA polymerase sigma-70 factor (ECF subfamily)
MQEKQAADEAQAHLLQRVAARDTEALAEFYDQTAGLLFSVAVRVLGDAAEAEEAIQDVFVQIWEKAATFDPLLGTPFHWAVSITRHRAIDRLRSRHRRARLLEDLGQLALEDPPTGHAPEGLAADEANLVRSALAGLPADQRQAIELAFFNGMTHLEIAQALQEPLGTIKARIRRGLMKLRETLGEYA